MNFSISYWYIGYTALALFFLPEKVAGTVVLYRSVQNMKRYCPNT